MYICGIDFEIRDDLINIAIHCDETWVTSKIINELLEKLKENSNG